MTEADKNLTFEQALSQLEEIVNQLERGEVSLDDAVAAYEKGSMLRKQCQQRLDEARLKVEKIRAERASSTVDGTAPFDADNT